MTLMRIRLSFERNLIKKCEQCWMLVNTEKCKIVQDLEYIIKKRFFVDQYDFVLNLYLEDFLLPSQERIEIIHNDDLISVKEEHLKTDKNTKSTTKKRKHDQCLENDDQKSKKLKHAPSKKTNTKRKKKEINNSKTWKPKNSSGKSKCQKASEFLNKLSQDVTKIFSADKNVVNTNEPKQQTMIVNETTNNNKPTAKTITVSKRSVETEKKINVEHNKGKTTNVNKKPRSKNKRNIKNNVDNKSSSSSSSSSDSEESDPSVEDSPPIKQPISTRTKQQIPTNNTVTKPSLPVEKQPKMNGCVSSNRGNNHIRFDDIDQSTPQPQLLPPPNILPSRNQTTTIPLKVTKMILQDNSPHLSPIHHITKNMNNTSPNLNKNANNNGKMPLRKDVYMNKSQVLESTRLDKSLDKELVEGKDIEDFTKYPLLNGPPRVGEMVAYKVIEMSQSYTPEISDYKKGKVLSFNTNTNSFTIKLNKESLSRVKGDGHVSSKFELNTEENDEEQQMEEINDKVDIPWHTMLQPRLLTIPVVI